MKNVYFNFGKQLSRRAVLRNAGICLGLPMLDAMTPAFATAAAAAGSAPKAKRFVGVSLALGLHSPNLVPERAGTDYQPSRYLRSLQDLRDQFTVVSGSSHPGVTGGHTAEGSIFSACPNQRGATSRNTISLDQLMAKQLGHETRFPSLVLNSGSDTSPSYTENGAMIPAEKDAVKVFTKLFVDDSPQEQERQAELIRQGRSVMDVIDAEAKSLTRELGAGDRDKLDAWFTSIRELENRLEANDAWVHQAKPHVDARPPKVDRNDTISVERAMFEVIALALQTDSTRFITLHMSGNAKVTSLEGVDESYHGLSHHGLDEEKLHQLAIVEQAVIDEWADFLRQLKAASQGERTLLDETMVILTSNLGNASSHNNKNMPVIFAGGGFQHGRHLAFDQKDNYPLPNLYLSALHQLGLQDETFATSTGEMDGLV
ncbi:MAG: DUF1552 domain-containing protein [Verrucomicrobiae bacterium]|nr:DUF1552 domain-containing protein [Verrucomicrobiae bacterium]